MKKRISILSLFLLVTSMSFLLSPEYGEAYPLIYSSDTIPQESSPAWTRIIADNDGNGYDDYIVIDESVSNGELHTQIKPNPDHANNYFCIYCHGALSGPYLLDFEKNLFPLSYKMNDDNLSNDLGTTVEARIKNINAQALAISLSDGTYYETLVIYAGSLELLMNSINGNSIHYYMETTDDFHSYRMTMQGNIVNVYADGALVMTGDKPIPTAEKSVKFGHIAHAQLGNRILSYEALWDCVKYAPGVNSLGSACVANNSPSADAGENVTISSDEAALTIIQGTVSDQDPDDVLECRWLSGETVLLDWMPVSDNGECPLALSSLLIDDGTFTLALEVTDGNATASDNMILTVNNSSPNAAPSGGGVYEIFADVTVGGSVSDFDGDLLSYEWSEGAETLCSGNVQAIAGGIPVKLPGCMLSTLSLGKHSVNLAVDDGINGPVSNSVMVEIVDTTVPTIAPVSNLTILWPPNHNMVDIVIESNAVDNSGIPVTLGVLVTSNESQDGLGDGDMSPDWTEPVIDQDSGIISLQLRAERSGSGEGRVYSITLMVEDFSGNGSVANIEIRVPHDKGNKK